MPISVSVNRVQLNDIALDVLGTEIKWKSFSTAATMEGRVLTLHPTKWDGIDITLAPTDANASVEKASTDKAATDKNADIELPEVLIPLDVVVEGFDIHNFALHGESPVKVNHLGLKAKASDHLVSIEKLVLDMPEVSADASTEIELKGDYSSRN